MAGSLKSGLIWAWAAALMWLHVALGFPDYHLGQGAGTNPDLLPTRFQLFIDSLFWTAPVFITARIAQIFGFRLLALPVMAGFWLWGGAMIMGFLSTDYGDTWTIFEALTGFFLHPVNSPIAVLALLALGYWALARPKVQGFDI
jgi:hypothetical protein